MENAVFLDRDNTLIANNGDLGDPDRVELLEGVAGGLRKLRDAGFRLIVVTNQGGVARGRFTEDDVDRVHQRIAELVDDTAGASSLINRFYYCPYHPEAARDEYRQDHPWRKPHPGMLLQAARDLNVDLGQSWMVGDQDRDIEAGRRAGCRTVMVTEDPDRVDNAQPTVAAPSFTEAVDAILESGSTTTASPPPPHRNGATMERSIVMPMTSTAPDLAPLERAMKDLVAEMRNQFAPSNEFTVFRLVAGMAQLLAVLLALLGLMQLATPPIFMMWMAGAILTQLTAIAMLLMDARR